MRKINTELIVLVLGLLLALLNIGTVSAACSQGAQSCSANYAVGQTFFGSGGALENTCSTNYCAKQSVGETATGLSKSNNYEIYAGFNVNRDPFLEFEVTSTSLNLGTLTTSSTAYGIASFLVKDYLSGGYTIITESAPPTNLAYSLSALSTPTAALAGTEEFGINLVSNTTICGAPANFGANPVQEPSSSFSYGAVASGYGTCGLFKYVQGGTIADSTKSTGETDFTISYIADISSTTPAGVYTMSQVLVAVPTY
jgi:hypothetical protein